VREAGYERVTCIGASLGVTACGTIADEPEMIGLVMMAGPNYGGSLTKLTYPKLFIASENDEWSPATQQVYELAGEPKELLMFPGAQHGTDLFASGTREQFLQALLDFLDGL
jgi:esterase/lipase